MPCIKSFTYAVQCNGTPTQHSMHIRCTATPMQRHCNANAASLQRQYNVNATSMQRQCNANAMSMRRQCNVNAAITPMGHACDQDSSPSSSYCTTILPDADAGARWWTGRYKSLTSTVLYYYTTSSTLTPVRVGGLEGKPQSHHRHHHTSCNFV